MPPDAQTSAAVEMTVSLRYVYRCLCEGTNEQNELYERQETLGPFPHGGARPMR